jgi:hypothetical protein
MENEIKSLESTESKFNGMGENSESVKESASIFFADLRLSYTEALKQLSNEQRNDNPPIIKSVSLRQTKPAQQTVHLIASGVFSVFDIHVLAYSLAATTQSLMFNLDVTSYPEGATISYKRRGDDFKTNTNPTNCTLKSLPLAIWTIHFQLSGYKEQDRDFNPFIEQNHVLNVNLTK